MLNRVREFNERLQESISAAMIAAILVALIALINVLGPWK